MLNRDVGLCLYCLILVFITVVAAIHGCARLPYTAQVVQQDQRVLVAIQHEVKRTAYTHPTQFNPDELKTVLNGFSVREKKKVPLRWFAEEVPPPKGVPTR